MKESVRLEKYRAPHPATPNRTDGVPEVGVIADYTGADAAGWLEKVDAEGELGGKLTAQGGVGNTRCQCARIVQWASLGEDARCQPHVGAVAQQPSSLGGRKHSEASLKRAGQHGIDARAFGCCGGYGCRLLSSSHAVRLDSQAVLRRSYRVGWVLLLVMGERSRMTDWPSTGTHLPRPGLRWRRQTHRCW